MDYAPLWVMLKLKLRLACHISPGAPRLEKAADSVRLPPAALHGSVDRAEILKQREDLLDVLAKHVVTINSN